MSTKRAREKPSEQLVIELDGLALPRRVARAAQMLARTIEALGGDAGKVTMVVSNRNMRAELRGWDELGGERVRTVARLVENPLEAIERTPERVHELRTAAGELAVGARELASVGGRFRRKGERKPIRRLDAAFANVMEAAAREPAPLARILEGTTEIYTSVLRVGRTKEGGEVQARLFVAGAPHDVSVDPRFVDLYFDAAKAGGTFRVSVRASWRERPDGVPVIDPRTVVALSLERWTPISGAQAIRELGALFSDDEADAILEHLTHKGDP